MSDHKKLPVSVSFSYAIRSFTGYLEGTQKSALTIKNYQLDLFAFRDFLIHEHAEKTLKLHQITRSDVDQYRHSLKEKGFKANTRRRKLLTVVQFLNYLAKRKKLDPGMAKKIPTPHKIERIPFTVSSVDLLLAIQKLPHETFMEVRNQVLLWALVETGCLVSEVSQFRYDQWSLIQAGRSTACIHLLGKSPRPIPISADLYWAAQSLKKFTKNSPWVFLGCNKFGPLGSPISPRGIEMLVKLYAPRLGFKSLTPRTIRHSVILQWFKDGVSQTDIQTRLGLKTTYAFRSYDLLFKSISQTTSTSETLQSEVSAPLE